MRWRRWPACRSVPRRRRPSVSGGASGAPRPGVTRPRERAMIVPRLLAGSLRRRREMEVVMTVPWRRAAWILVTVLLLPTLVLADGGGGGGGDPTPTTKREDPDYSAGVKAIEAKQYATAIPLLESAAKRTPDDADTWNWLAY